MAVQLIHPLPSGTPTDQFGWRPAIPGVRPAELHNGTDSAAPAGTPIRAAHAGRVSYVGWDAAGGGWMVKIGAAFGATLYLHMRERSPLVDVGDHVTAGQIIGYVGATGAATGPHLHFMLQLAGVYVDPIPYITATPLATSPQHGQKEEERMELWIADVGGTWYFVVPTGAGKPNATSLPGDSGMGDGGAAKAGIPVVRLKDISALRRVANV